MTDTCLNCVTSAVFGEAKEVELLRFPSSSYNDKGRWEDRDPVSVKIQAAIQPVTGKELEDVPEGRRARENIKLYTVDLIQTTCPTNKTQADLVIWNGKKYEIFSVQNWTDFFKGMATLQEEQG